MSRALFFQPFYIRLFNSEAVFWTKYGTGQWVKLQDAIFMKEDFSTAKVSDDCNAARLYVSTASGDKTVKAPVVLMKALKKFWNVSLLTMVGPDSFRQRLKTSEGFLERMPREDKLKLLAYAISDDEIKDMTGIKLIPVHGGKFGTFLSTGNPVFVDSDKHSRILLPGLKDWFVDRDISGELWSSFTKASKAKRKFVT